MIVLFRSNNIFSSRVNKYVDYYNTAGLDYHIFGWDRLGENIHKEKYSFFKYNCGYSVGGAKALLNHFMWMVFVFRSLLKMKDVTTIHACDLNSAFPAAVYKSIFNRNIVLIFDVCDWFSANFRHYKKIEWLLGKMEKYTVSKANEVIICEPERINQIPFSLKKKELVLPNIPSICDPTIFEEDKKYLFYNDKITLAYFGGFNNERFLLELLSIISEGSANLLIGGFGNLTIENKCRELESFENFRYFGKMSMNDGLRMSNHADLIYAMYCTSNPNNIYAAPNKYYEALFLGKPIISTKGTILESKIQNHGIGYIISENTDELRVLIKNLVKEDIKKRGNTARKIWDNKFNNYVSDFFSTAYSKVIR